MKIIVSASRRTDLISFFPEWLSSVVKKESVRVYGPSRNSYVVNLSPDSVHTLVLWSKNFSNLIENRFSLRDAVKKYDNLYFHFTITGLGGSIIERGVPSPEVALSQLDFLIEIAESPEHISIRFDPIIYWREGKRIRTNLLFFEKLAPQLHKRGIKHVRFSFAQWYKKAVRRAQKHRFSFFDPSEEEKIEAAKFLVKIADQWKLCLYSCAQNFLIGVEGISRSSCIDGAFLQNLHPENEPASTNKDKTQRKECGCTESLDIGSYTQFCPHSCLYCYANPKM